MIRVTVRWGWGEPAVAVERGCQRRPGTQVIRMSLPNRHVQGQKRFVAWREQHALTSNCPARETRLTGQTRHELAGKTGLGLVPGSAASPEAQQGDKYPGGQQDQPGYLAAGRA